MAEPHPCVTCPAVLYGRRLACPVCAGPKRRSPAPRHQTAHLLPAGYPGLMAVRLAPEPFSVLFARSKALAAAEHALSVLESSKAPTVRRARRRR